MRYDRGWHSDPSRGRYDSEMGRRYEGFERARRWNGWPAPPEPSGDDAEYGVSAEPLYGPARYGLGPYYERLRRRRRPDAEVKRDIEEALFYDTWVNADAISVEVNDGVATLSGVLPSYDEVRFATDDAWDVQGVLGVRCELTVDEG